MRTVRIWFTKEIECKYISHLDLNRCMLRAVRRARLPLWYTEGFNPHPFVTFPLPMSLGLSGKRECMDIRIIDDSYDINMIPAEMNKYLPTGIRVFSATYPEMEPKAIAYAKYYAEISSDSLDASELYNAIEKIKTCDSLIIKKKSKAGLKDVDVLPYIKIMEIQPHNSEFCSFDIVLPAGNTKNVALTLLLKAIEEKLGIEIYYDIVKLDMYTEDMKQFV
ncbi:MAG: TIGR03936 family radical SAM-associated protein [Ruminococcus sp.]